MIAMDISERLWDLNSQWITSGFGLIQIFPWLQTVYKQKLRISPSNIKNYIKFYLDTMFYVEKEEGQGQKPELRCPIFISVFSSLICLNSSPSMRAALHQLGSVLWKWSVSSCPLVVLSCSLPVSASNSAKECIGNFEY